MTEITPEAILFDFDGVLADTMGDNFRSWQKAMADFGLSVEAKDYYIREGMRLTEVARQLWVIARPGTECHPQEIVDKKEFYYLQDRSFSFYPGVEEFIDQLYKKQVPIALVTAALQGRLAASVPNRFLEKFKAIVSGEKTARGKPFPDPYLEAAREIGVPIHKCVVIENAPLGIEAAKSAGAYCVAITSTLGVADLEGADEIVEKFENLRDLEVIKKVIA